VVSNPGYMKDNFYITIETFHIADRGEKENVHELDKKALKDRQVVPIDIANDAVTTADYKKETDPKLYKSEKTGRGPLSGDWRDSTEPVMTAYKLVTVNSSGGGCRTRLRASFRGLRRGYSPTSTESCSVGLTSGMG